jgi:alkylation response protein AidB-like acyl-CoA dehydrogenase
LVDELINYADEADAWLKQHSVRRPALAALVWGEGSDDVALFKNLTVEEERAHLDAARDWQRIKSDAGYGSITWPSSCGGAGLSRAHEAAFARLEAQFSTPNGHEAVGITIDVVAPTILACGTPKQQERYLRPMRRTDELWCMLFSEPGAGSDLASVSTRAVRDGHEWVIDGQKVWTSGAQYAAFGYAIARTDPDGGRHEGLTAFLIPMDAAGVDVRPLRQMSGGSSFNEVFLTGVRVPDTARLGAVGDGWKVAVTTLGFERSAGTKSGVSGADIFERLVLLARHGGRDGDPVVRQALARIYSAGRVRTLTRRRAVGSLKVDGSPGPEGSVGKLAWTEGNRAISDLVSILLGPELVADSGAWGTYAWSDFVCGAPGFRIGGGTDEIQRNTIAERVLGLPRS